jgi:hypothetical protein
MKILLKLILVIAYIPIFLIFLVAANLRFQLLTPAFWNNTFGSESVYSKLSVSINKNLESQTIAEGGKASDVRVLTEIISPENLKDTIEKNLSNILLYADGKAKELIIYVPVDKIPKSLLSVNFDKVTEQMKLGDLLKEFNMFGVSPEQIQIISHVGTWSWILLGTTLSILFLFLYLLYSLTDPGKRLVANGLALTISGIIALLATGAGTVIRINWAKDLAGSSLTGDSLIGILVPPVIHGVLGIWLVLAAISFVLGFILFFVKKPIYNKERKKK